MDKAERERLREIAEYMVAARGLIGARDGASILQALDALDAAEARLTALRSFVDWLHTETFRVNDDGSIPWSLWVTVQDRARAALAADDAARTDGKA